MFQHKYKAVFYSLPVERSSTLATTTPAPEPARVAVVEFTYPPGSAFIPIANWETQANLVRPDLLPALSLCTSVFVKSWVADAAAFTYLFKLLDDGGEMWANMHMQAWSSGTDIGAAIGKGDDAIKIAIDTQLPVYFPQKWFRVCMSVDPKAGLVTLVANGELVEAVKTPGLAKVMEDRPSNMSLRIGQNGGIHAKWAGLNVFSSALSLERMVGITTAGGEECGAPGDFLSWEEAEWELSDRWASGPWADWVLVINSSKVLEVEVMEGPCWRESTIQVYQLDTIHAQSDCMEHCQKIGGGRSPAVGSLEEWVRMTREVNAISPRTQEHCHMWLAATEGNQGTVDDIGQIPVNHMLY